MLTRELIEKARRRVISGASINYQLQYRKCGRKNCECYKGKGEGHGPYWYAYYQASNGSLRSLYLGKDK